MSLSTALDKARATADQLKSRGAANEANTRALVVEPVLAALGWNVADFDEVDREFRVYDGTTLDYALKIGGRPRLFLEAKGATKTLNDKQFIAQTVNYANNEGVVWCVLTNGLVYRVYKTNEPVAMDQKLLFEVDLTEEALADRRRTDELELISRDAVEAGRLDSWGDRVFIDSRVRQALAEVAAEPPPELISRLQAALGRPEVAVDRLGESLGRILGAKSAEVGGRPDPSGGHSSTGPRPPGERRPTKNQYSLDHHLTGKPAVMADLFEQLDTYAMGLGGDVTRRVRKFYVGYYAGSKERSFFTAEVQRQKIYVYLSLDPSSVEPWNAEALRDVRKIGHYGMGDTEYVLRNASQIDEVRTLVKKAYDAVH